MILNKLDHLFFCAIIECNYNNVHFFVQNIDQKVAAIRAGIGIGHLPLQRIKDSLAAGELLALPLASKPQQECFLVWRISNKGKGLQELCKRLIAGI
jgi:DNA-binding transcriptional LysR family regulator